MLRTLVKFCVIGVLALLAIRLFFGLFGMVVWLSILAICTAIVGAVVYVGIAIVSPSTAKKLNDRFRGGPGKSMSDEEMTQHLMS